MSSNNSGNNIGRVIDGGSGGRGGNREEEEEHEVGAAGLPPESTRVLMVRCQVVSLRLRDTRGSSTCRCTCLQESDVSTNVIVYTNYS